jgi:predicted phage terminase large subunit-like protein
MRKGLTPITKAAVSRYFSIYAEQIEASLEMTEFHRNYYAVLEAFAEGRIKRLIVSIAPQHGKSTGSSRILPSYLLGKAPDKKITISSYAATLAKSFNRDVQRYMDTREYRYFFPSTKIPRDGQHGKGKWVRNNDEFEIVGRKGGLRAVGRGGALTGYMVDIMIMDDIYKDYKEANSPLIRDAAWDWYINVVKTRLHNDSQELIVFTRWHEDDIIGRIEEVEKVVTITSLEQIEGIEKNAWVKVNFEAIKDSPKTDLDNRNRGDALWSSKHGIESLIEKRKLSPIRFECLYQGAPESKEGLLYERFKTYVKLPVTHSKKAKVDTADKGDDFLCAITYEVGADGYVYVTDVLYTQEPMEVTEKATQELLERNGTRACKIESNNGGRGFARVIKANVKGCKVTWYHQSENKEARILTNAPIVNDKILFPQDWEQRWKEFYKAVTKYKRLFRANKHDDAVDVLTAIAEDDLASRKKRII